MASFEEFESEDKREKARRQVQGIIGFFKIRSFSELVDKIVYILAAIVAAGVIMLIGAMMGWVALGGLLATAILIWVLQLGWLWIVR